MRIEIRVDAGTGGHVCTESSSWGNNRAGLLTRVAHQEVEKLLALSDAELRKMLPEPELLPCPFCGGEAIYGENGLYYEVRCPSCSIATLDRVGYTQRRTVAEVWNKRA